MSHQLEQYPKGKAHATFILQIRKVSILPLKKNYGGVSRIQAANSRTPV
jgi:hypothetical protein